MGYHDPKKVVSPQVSVSDVDPIYDEGEWQISFALLKWEHEPALGMRWNGGDEGGRRNPGVPQSRGLATWMIVPEIVELPILKKIFEIGPGGGSIDPESAKKKVIDAIKEREPAFDRRESEAAFEARVVAVVRRMKEAGEI
jgi:hypothetical protein